jgi:uncharacterized protein (DUF58 family)
VSDSLLDPAYVRALERLRVELRRRVAGTRAGEHRAMRRGASVEFAEHRAYTPGDDPRRIDWNAYARLGDLVVRLYAAEEDVTVRLIVDGSASMGFGAPAKLDVARRLAAGVGHLALHGSERVALYVGADARPPMRGPQRVHALLAALDAARAEGATRPDAAADAILRARAAGPGVAMLFSDLLDEGATLRAATRLAAARHEVTVVHVLAAEELDPGADGASVLRDSETGEDLELVLDDDARRAYRGELARFVEASEAALRRVGVRYVRAFADRPALDVLTEALTGRAARSAPWSS